MMQFEVLKRMSLDNLLLKKKVKEKSEKLELIDEKEEKYVELEKQIEQGINNITQLKNERN